MSAVFLLVLLGLGVEDLAACGALSKGEASLPIDLPALMARATSLEGRLDVRCLYGRLSRADAGGATASLFMRLGLDKAREVTFALDAKPAEGLHARFTLALAEPAVRGVLATLARAEVLRVPRGGGEYVRALIHPKRLYDLVSSIVSQLAPLETAMVNAHLQGIAGRLGKRLGEEILGDEARVFSAYFSGGEARLLVAQIADGEAARAFVAEAISLLPGLAPGITVTRTKASASEIYEVWRRARPWLAIAVMGDAVLVAPRASAVRSWLLRKTPLAEVPAFESAALLARLEGRTVAALLRAAKLGESSAGIFSAGAPGMLTFTAMPTERGARLTARVESRRR